MSWHHTIWMMNVEWRYTWMTVHCQWGICGCTHTWNADHFGIILQGSLERIFDRKYYKPTRVTQPGSVKETSRTLGLHSIVFSSMTMISRFWYGLIKLCTHEKQVHLLRIEIDCNGVMVSISAQLSLQVPNPSRFEITWWERGWTLSTRPTWGLHLHLTTYNA